MTEEILKTDADKNKNVGSPHQGVLVMRKIHELRNLVNEVESTRMDSAGMKYNYLSERTLTTTIRPHMQKLGLVAVPVKTVSKTTSHMVGEKDGKPRYVLLTEESKQYLVMDITSGDSIIVSVEGSGADSMDKGTNKCETCARKNFYKELLNLPSPDRDDPDSTPSSYGARTTSYSSGGGGSSYGDVGGITLKYGVHAGKTLRQLYEENPNEVVKLANGTSKWIAEKATEFLNAMKKG